MKNVRTTNVMRNSAMSPATMNASRYSRRTSQPDGAGAAAETCSVCSLVAPSAAAPLVAGAGRMLSASRTTANTQMRPRSSIGVMTGGETLACGFPFLDARCLTDLVAQVIQTAAADDAAA